MKVSAPPGAVSWEEVRGRLDQNEPFSNMFDTPLYRDAVWEQFSKAEYARRYAALRDKMREHKLDVVIVPGGPSHWSFGGGMTWLTGHWEWHAISSYVVVPLEAEPTLIFSMGGTHAEAVRRQVEPALSDVRQSRGGRYAEVMVERINELGLRRPRIGLVEIDPRHKDYMPVNQYNDLRAGLPDAEIVFTRSFIHELVVIKSEAELECVRRAGALCARAMEAMVARGKAGRDRIGSARRRGRRDHASRRRRRFPHHRIDVDGEPVDVLRQPAAVRTQAQARRHHHHGAGGGLSRLHRPDRLADLPRRADRHGEAVLARDHVARLSKASSPRSSPAIRSTTSASRRSSSARTACSRGRPRSTASTS